MKEREAPSFIKGPVPERETPKAITRSDMQGIRQAIARGWNPSIENLTKWAEQIRALLADPLASNRDRAKAEETLAVVEKAIGA